jgi:hypothetical protein
MIELLLKDETYVLSAGQGAEGRGHLKRRASLKNSATNA